MTKEDKSPHACQTLVDVDHLGEVDHLEGVDPQVKEAVEDKDLHHNH